MTRRKTAWQRSARARRAAERRCVQCALGAAGHPEVHRYKWAQRLAAETRTNPLLWLAAAEAENPLETNPRREPARYFTRPERPGYPKDGRFREMGNASPATEARWVMIASDLLEGARDLASDQPAVAVEKMEWAASEIGRLQKDTAARQALEARYLEVLRELLDRGALPADRYAALSTIPTANPRPKVIRDWWVETAPGSGHYTGLFPGVGAFIRCTPEGCSWNVYHTDPDTDAILAKEGGKEPTVEAAMQKGQDAAMKMIATGRSSVDYPELGRQMRAAGYESQWNPTRPKVIRGTLIVQAVDADGTSIEDFIKVGDKTYGLNFLDRAVSTWKPWEQTELMEYIDSWEESGYKIERPGKVGWSQDVAGWEWDPERNPSRTDAKAQAERVRERGRRARVLPAGGEWEVFVDGARHVRAAPARAAAPKKARAPKEKKVRIKVPAEATTKDVQKAAKIAEKELPAEPSAADIASAMKEALAQVLG